VRTRAARRIAVIASGVLVPLLASAGPVMANVKPDDGQVPGPSLGVGNTLLIFVVIPVGAFLIIAALSVLPSSLSRPRYRPGKPWEHEATWVGRPEAPATESETSARGGASAEW
jgi:hypothetical protein